MKNKRLKLVWEASGYMDSQLIKNYLESFGLEVYVFGESVGFAYGLTATPLGRIEIYVLAEQEEEALAYLQDYNRKDELKDPEDF